MKTSIKHILCSFMLLGLIAGCGKKESGGNNNDYNNHYNSGNIGQSGVDAMNNLKKWYNNANQEGQNIGSTGDFLRKNESLYGGHPTGGNQFNWEFNFDFDFFAPWDDIPTVQPSHCYRRKANNVYEIGTPSGYNCINRVEMKKSNNTKLKQAVNGQSGLKLLNATQNGTLYTLYYGVYNENSYYPAQPTLMYVIDTSRHSIFNPIQIIDARTSSGTKDYFMGSRVITY